MKFASVLSFFVLVPLVFSKIHRVNLNNEYRNEFILTSFGYLKGGYLFAAVNFSLAELPKNTKELQLGLTICRKFASGMPKCWKNANANPSNQCPLKAIHSSSAKDISDMIVINFNFEDPQNPELVTSFVGETLENLKLFTVESIEATYANYTLYNRKANVKKYCDQPLNGSTMAVRSVNSKNKFSFAFCMFVGSDSEEGLYRIHFHNCGSGTHSQPKKVSVSAFIIEHNPGSFLSAGEIPLPQMYIILSGVFFLLGIIWLGYLQQNKEHVFKIHYLMGLLVFVKSLSFFFFHSINFHFIGNTGEHKETWAVLYYIVHLMKGALLIITIVLIGAGWAFIKHILTKNEKKVFLVVIPLQIIANVAQIIIAESDESSDNYQTWKQIFILVDLLCCGAVLFPVVWSIRHLQEAASVDGKVAVSLQKLKLFKHFYITIVVYIYFTRIIVYLLQIVVPFQLEWLYEMFTELAALVFFTITGYKFRPISNNPYLKVPDHDEEDIEISLTKNGLLESVSKVVRISAPEDEENERTLGQGARARNVDSSNEPLLESSHELD